jgi:lipopolysaccharide assembly protein A
MFRVARIILIVLALFLGMMFALFNAGSVTVDYLFGSLQISLVALMILDLLVGLAIGAVIYAPRVISLKLELDRLKKKLSTAEGELRNLRNLPIRDA